MVKGGAVLPVNFKLTDVVTLTTVPEVDIYKDSADDGRHLSTAQLVNLGVTLSHDVTLYEALGRLELQPGARSRNTPPTWPVSYEITGELQIDTGVHFGLTARRRACRPMSACRRSSSAGRSRTQVFAVAAPHLPLASPLHVGLKLTRCRVASAGEPAKR